VVGAKNRRRRMEREGLIPTQGDPTEGQVKPGSTVQELEQPSPAARLPSSLFPSQ
jgi:hypothetical protein